MLLHFAFIKICSMEKKLRPLRYFTVSFGKLIVTETKFHIL